MSNDDTSAAPLTSAHDAWSTPVIRSSVEVPVIAVPTSNELTRAETQDLLTYLAANVDVARADGRHDKAARFQGLLKTAKALVTHADLAGAVK